MSLKEIATKLAETLGKKPGGAIEEFILMLSQQRVHKGEEKNDTTITKANRGNQ